jgi:hypothetical protein
MELSEAQGEFLFIVFVLGAFLYIALKELGILILVGILIFLFLFLRTKLNR